jgi:nucleoside phosphorylase
LIHRRLAMAEVDVLVVTALQEEFDAVLDVASGGTAGDPGVAIWVEHDEDPPPYHLGEYRLAGGGALVVALARPVEKGGTAAGAVAGFLAERLRPQCLAMSGVCAGNPARVVLGDVIFASFTYRYQEGKQSTAGFHPDHRQTPARESWIRAAQDLPLTGLSTYGLPSEEEARRWVLERLLAREDPRANRGRSRYIADQEWAAMLAGLESEGLITVPVDRPRLTRAGREYVQRVRYRDVSPPQTLPYRVVTGPVASGDVVVKDGLTWDQLRAHGVETVAGLEMEAATVARTASSRDDLHWIVVKGVMDHADPRKNDRFRPFAARASAEVMFRLLASRLVPRAHVPPQAETLDGSAVALGLSGPVRAGWPGPAASSGSTGPARAPRRVHRQAGHVFISYVREDSHHIDQLQQAMEATGIPVWRDTSALWPGEDWRAKIRQAITDDALVFVACYSHASLRQRRSYQNEELVLAIEQLRQRRPDDSWLIPVRLDECEIPDLDLGGGRTIASIQRADLFGERYGEELAKLIAAVSRILGRKPGAMAGSRTLALAVPAGKQRTGRWRQKAGLFRFAVTAPLIAAALLAAGGYLLLSQIPGGQGSITVTGSVACESGRPVAGVWIAASTGQPDSGLAHLGPLSASGISYPIGSSGTYSYRLPHGGSYAVHVGCGGTAHNWASSNYSALLSSRTVHLRCQDPSAPARGTTGRGQCLATSAR